MAYIWLKFLNFESVGHPVIIGYWWDLSVNQVFELERFSAIKL